jgi:hypothetical protein
MKALGEIKKHLYFQENRVKYNQQHYMGVFNDEESKKKLADSISSPSLLNLVEVSRFLLCGKKSLKITRGVIRIRISKKNRQHNGQKKKVHKDKQRSTKHTHKTKDQVTRTPLKTGVNSGAP